MKNLIDLIVDVDYECYRKIIEVVCKDENVDVFFVICVLLIFILSEEIVRVVIEVECDKLVIVNFMVGELVKEG